MNPRRRTILVVDDDQEYLQELGDMLTMCGYETVTCGNVESSLRLASRLVPDLVLLDLKMLPKSGLQLADELKHQRQTADIPIVAMTGHYTAQEHGRLMQLCGIQDCLQKPFTPLEAITKIERALA